MTAGTKLNERYEKLEVLGEGGMGIVYRAWDANLKCEVALKTLRDIQDKHALDLFRKEVAVLARITHPNIVDIYEVGEIIEKEGRRPYFVMPFLRGETLDKLIRSSSRRLTVERCIDVISQVCRGLQAAHAAGLVHRDLKPSNLFILEDDSVKIIDFGVAHLIDAHSTAGLKGTLLYMSPEQLLLKKPTPLSDLFSVAVVCFTAMTGRHPFEGTTGDEIAESIVKRSPPPASDFNPSINLALSQVIHKGMAKQPFQRFPSVREFAENLQKAYRNEPLDWYDPARVEARVQRARKAFERGEVALVADIVSELEAEASIHPELGNLRKQVDAAVRQQTVSQLLDSARHCLENMEYQLALQKVEEALSFDRTNKDASALKGEIEDKKSTEQVEDWLKLAGQHLENHSYAHARQAVQNVLKLKPKDTRAQQLITEVDRREQDYNHLRQEKEAAYRAAIEAFEKGELSSALTKLERVLDMDRRAPDTLSVDRGAQYQKLYNEVRSEHDLLTGSYAEARRCLESGNFAAALEICSQVLSRYPDNAPFQMLKLDAEDRQRQERSGYVARISREVDAEPDLNRKIHILEEALSRYSDESFFQRSSQSIRSKRDLVEAIVAKARNFETTGQYSEALGQWEILRQVYAPYPGLDFEVDRVRKRREQKDRTEARRRWIDEIDRTVEKADHGRAVDLCAAALAEFPNDPELITAAKAAEEGLQRTTEAQRLVSNAEELLREGKTQEATSLLWEAQRLDTANSRVRTVLVRLLLNEAEKEIDSDWSAAEQHIVQALEVDPGNGRADSFLTLIKDRKEQQSVTEVLSRVRVLRSNGQQQEALEALDQALARYPRNADLQQQRAALLRSIEDEKALQARRQDLEQARALGRHAHTVADVNELRTIFEQTQALATRYSNDVDFDAILREVRQRMNLASTEPPQPAPPQKGKPEPPRPTAGDQSPSRKTPASRDPAAGFRGKLGALPKWQQITLFSVALAAALVVFSTVASLYMADDDAGPAAPVLGRVIVKVEPANAEVVIQDGKNRIVTAQADALPAGEYLVRASAPGFETAERKISVSGSAATPVVLELIPATPVFELYTSMEGIEGTLDGQPLQTTALIPTKLADGEHTLNIASKGGGKVNLAFRSHVGAMPEITSLSASQVRAVAVLADGKRLTAVRPGGTEPVSFALGSSTPEQIADSGLSKDGISAGNHTVALLYGPDRVELPLDVTSHPKLTLFLTINENVGYLLLDAGQPNVRLEVNGVARRARRGGANRLTLALEPREYRVRVLKDGFYPEERQITIQKGLQSPLKLTLREIPTSGTLLVRNARGAEIQVNNSSWNQPAADGTLSLQASAGTYTVRIRRPGFRPIEQVREVAAGEESVVDVSQLSFQPLLWRVRFNSVPGDATLRLSGPDGKDLPVSGRATELRDGKYRLTASAPGHEDGELTFDVAGKEQTVEVRLNKRAERPTAPQPTSGGMEGWESAKDWKQDGDWFRRQGSNPTFYRTSTGNFQFSVPCGRFSCDARILAAYLGPGQHVRIEYERNRVKWRIVSGGVTEQGSAAHKSSAKGILHINVTVSSGTISLADPQDGYKEIARIPVPDVDWNKAKFGTTEKEMANFKYVPR